MTDRFAFGANWASFVAYNFNPERRVRAKERLLGFLGADDLRGTRFLDIGSGSGLHSLAAYDAGAKEILSFDYDEISVSTTRRLAAVAGAPQNWKIEQGDVLDTSYLVDLGQWDLVYSWGVLHHTGQMWQAVANAAKLVAPGGRLFIALYSSDAVKPSAEFWLDVKRRYNAASEIEKKRMELWYLWRFGIGRNPLRLPMLLQQMSRHMRQRGMDYMTDVRDWLGGWPMEFAADQETVDFLEANYGFVLKRIARGEANTEFLFEQVGNFGKKTTIEGGVGSSGGIKR